MVNIIAISDSFCCFADIFEQQKPKNLSKKVEFWPKTAQKSIGKYRYPETDTIMDRYFYRYDIFGQKMTDITDTPIPIRY